MRPLLLTKAGIQAAYRLNVDNLREISHSTEPTPLATMADIPPSVSVVITTIN